MPILLNILRYGVLTMGVFLISFCCAAQHEKPFSFAVKDGLPSNYVYRCMEDDHGFLWVATDAGLARFDGKHFQLYTTKDGLPDNVVLALEKEKNGRIWVNCFKQSPAYFDEIKNRFVIALDKKTLAKTATTFNMYLFSLENEGVMYFNSIGSFVFKNKKMTVYSSQINKKLGLLIKENKDKTQLRWGTSILGKTIRHYIYHTKGNDLIDSSLIIYKGIGAKATAINNEKFYLFLGAQKKCFIISALKTNPIRYQLDSISIPETFTNSSFTPTSFYLLAPSGKIYVFDKKSLKQTDVVSGNYLPNSYYNDSKGNKWISTIDKGLVVYRRKLLNTIEMPHNYFKTNFLSIVIKDDGTLLAGNYYGEVLEIKKGKFTVHTVTKMVTSRTRQILLSGKDVFTFSEEGIFFNYKNPIINPLTNKHYPAKNAINFNDSTILVGTHYGLLKLNIRTKKIREVQPVNTRITALAKANENFAYFGSNDGLYKYNDVKNSATSMAGIHPMLNERITALCYTKDNILWIGTSSNGVIALKDEKILMRINTNNSFNHSATRNIIIGKPGQIWIATAQGISKVNYKLNGNQLKYTSQNLAVIDGLNSNEVQEMIYKNGYIYAATTDGITVIPENFEVPKFNIPTHLVRLRVNQKDTIIAKNYDLKFGQQNLQMKFAGVDLSGHFKNFQYTLDKNVNWINLSENTLTVQLSDGEHVLQVRALDVNGNISNQILTIKFNIATPFWKTIWFWVVTGIVLQILIIYLINKHQKRRKELRLAKKIAEVQTAALEQQAFTSLMNPHFIFNALNSIQHYINVQDRQNANRYLSDFASLIRKNFEAAQDSFIPLEEEIENIKLYLNLEQMRFDEQFKFVVNIDRDLDVEDWMIPTMILQPLLENALLHGIMPSSLHGKLSISFKQQNKDLLIIITDNGIGLINSNVLKANNTHKSRGMELIRKRIKALSSFDSQPITFLMEPAFKSKKNPGNKITLFIPAALYTAWIKAKKYS